MCVQEQTWHHHTEDFTSSLNLKLIYFVMQKLTDALVMDEQTNCYVTSLQECKNLRVFEVRELIKFKGFGVGLSAMLMMLVTAWNL